MVWKTRHRVLGGAGGAGGGAGGAGAGAGAAVVAANQTSRDEASPCR